MARAPRHPIRTERRHSSPVVAASLQPTDIWTEPLERLFSRLSAAPSGLTGNEAETRLAEFGRNDATAVKQVPLWLRLLGRFRNPLVIIPLAASGDKERRRLLDRRHQSDRRFQCGIRQHIGDLGHG
jgi:hypothetical protein